jgi:hypothetical protein
MKLLVVLLLASTAAAASLEQVLVANYLGLGLRDVVTTSKQLGTYFYVGQQKYQCAEINPVAARLIGNGGGKRAAVVGLGGVALGYAVYRAAPRRLKIPVLAALNAAELWALGTWGISATLTFNNCPSMVY